MESAEEPALPDNPYSSIDIEADGPIPGRESMLSFGCEAFTQGTGRTPIATVAANGGRRNRPGWR